jgi:tRNA G18 (ribose-2'-O)-methylase SpoU
LTGYLLHRGLIAAMHRPELPAVVTLLKGARRVVVLENVVDPTNVGAIFRSVAAIGADAVLVTPRCSDPFYRRAIRVSMGTVLQVPWTRVGDWTQTKEVLVASGFHIAALALAGNAVDLKTFAAGAPDRVALVLGAEGDGLTPEALAAADTIVTIPMAHGIDSLNVAATAAVAMYALMP